jgi:hypothetical protein
MPPNCPSQADKPPVRWPGGRAASGGSELHGGTPAAHRSLRIFRQSPRLPCRVGAGMWGGLQLRVSTLGALTVGVFRLSLWCLHATAAAAFRRPPHPEEGVHTPDRPRRPDRGDVRGLPHGEIDVEGTGDRGQEKRRVWGGPGPRPLSHVRVTFPTPPNFPV